MLHCSKAGVENVEMARMDCRVTTNPIPGLARKFLALAYPHPEKIMTGKIFLFLPQPQICVHDPVPPACRK